MKRLLLIDNDPHTRALIAHYMDRLYELFHAPTAARALTLLQTQPVDIVVTEYRLPDMSGLDLLKEIKSRYPRLPVIMATAQGSEWVCALAWRLGVRDYLIKPFDAGDLLSSVRFVLSAREASRECRTNVVAQNTSGRTLDPTGEELAIAKAVRYMQEHYTERVTLAAVGRHVGMSRFVLLRAVRVQPLVHHQPHHHGQRVDLVGLPFLLLIGLLGDIFPDRGRDQLRKQVQQCRVNLSLNGQATQAARLRSAER